MREPYRVLLADPPWAFRKGGAYGKRTADSFYATMSLEEICGLNAWLFELSASVSVCFLWCPCSILPDALHVLRAWGYTFKTVAFAWQKLSRRPLNSRAYLAAKAAGRTVVFYADPLDRNPRPYTLFTGMGHYSRQSVELCLLGTRGRLERHDRGVPQTLVAPVQEHSRKPRETYGLIERLYGPQRRLELFARAPGPPAGWDAWGDEATEVHHEALLRAGR